MQLLRCVIGVVVVCSITFVALAHNGDCRNGYILAPDEPFYARESGGNVELVGVDGTPLKEQLCVADKRRSALSTLNTWPPRAQLVLPSFQPADAHNVTAFNTTVIVPATPVPSLVRFLQRLSSAQHILASDYYNLAAVLETHSGYAPPPGTTSNWTFSFAYTIGGQAVVSQTMDVTPGDVIAITMLNTGRVYVSVNGTRSELKSKWLLIAKSKSSSKAVSLQTVLDWSINGADLTFWSLFVTDCDRDYPTPKGFAWRNIGVAVDGKEIQPAWKNGYARASNCAETLTASPTVVKATWK